MRNVRPFRRPWRDTFLLAVLVLLVGAPARSCLVPPVPPQPPAPPPAPTQAPRAPAPADVASAVQIDGSEWLEWDQEGASLTEVQAYRFDAFVGISRVQLQDVQCATAAAGKNTFVCRSRLPALTRGIHRLRIAPVYQLKGHAVLGPWSRPLVLRKNP